MYVYVFVRPLKQFFRKINSATAYFFSNVLTIKAGTECGTYMFGENLEVCPPTYQTCIYVGSFIAIKGNHSANTLHGISPYMSPSGALTESTMVGAVSTATAKYFFQRAVQQHCQSNAHVQFVKDFLKLVNDFH